MAGTGGQIVLGLTGVGLIADFRDLIHDIGNWKWSWSHVGKTALDALGLLPVIGMVKYVDEAGTVVEILAKNGDDVIEVGQVAARNADELGAVQTSTRKRRIPSSRHEERLLLFQLARRGQSM